MSAFLLVYKGIENIAKSEGRAIQSSDFLVDTISRNIILSLAATIGLYIVVSVLFVGPPRCGLVEIADDNLV